MMAGEEHYNQTDSQRHVIKQLTNKIAELRIGRRILMNLLEVQQEENQKEIEILKRENEALRRKNRQMAMRIWKETIPSTNMERT
jgi:TolA-binding protein